MLLRLAIAWTINLSLVAAGLWGLARALRPRAFAGAAGRRALRRAIVGGLVVTLALEVLGRRFAPLGGGAWRPLLGLERSALIVGAAVGLAWIAGRVLAAIIPSRVLAAAPPGSRGGARLAAAPEGVRAVVGGAPAAMRGPFENPVRQGDTTVDGDRREALVRVVTFGAFGVAAPAALYGGLRERGDIEVTELEVFVAGLPPALEGLSFVQLTDLHVGVFTGRRELKRIGELVRRIDADHLVITGDILDHSPRHIAEGMELLSKFHARRGRWAALGNHDHYTGPRKVYEGLRRTGIVPLVNASVDLGGLVLAGVDDIMAPRLRTGVGPDLAGALQGRDPAVPVVLLAHNPVCFDLPGAGRAALQLSGHTHGGQINPGGAVRALLPYVAGRFAREASVMYVSRGLGVTGPPVRFGARPEIVRIALTGRRRG